MRYIRYFSILVFVLLGCRQKVEFSPQVSTPLGSVAPAPVDDGEEVVPVRPPRLVITQKPEDHFSGGSTQAIFEATPGDNPVNEIACSIGSSPVACDLSNNTILLSGFENGTYKLTVEIKDSEGLSSADQASWTITDEFVAQTKKLDVGVWNNQADILFVVDNSISMQEEQLEIANRINSFFEKLVDLDWRVGIITTDPYARDLINGTPNPLADGVLLKFPNDDYFIDSKLGLIEAKKLFSDTIFRPERGNGHERGIHNTYRSIERFSGPSNTVNDRLKAFYRPQASFSVVLISDEDETLVNGVGRPLPNLGKSEGANLVELVRDTWGEQKLFQFNSVIVKPGEDECIGSNEKFGVAYAELSRATEGLIESICAEDYTGALKNIGSNVANLQKRYELDCIPQDIDGDGEPNFNVVASGSEPVPAYSLSGKQVEFDSPLKEGEYELKYFCPLP